MRVRKIIALALLIVISFETQTSVFEHNERVQEGTLIYVGPTIRLVYEFTPEQWGGLGLELQLEQIHLDSLCYTDYWLRGARRYYKTRWWKERIADGTEESRAWGIEPKDTSKNHINLGPNTLLFNNGMVR